MLLHIFGHSDFLKDKSISADKSDETKLLAASDRVIIVHNNAGLSNSCKQLEFSCNLESHRLVKRGKISEEFDTIS